MYGTSNPLRSPLWDSDYICVQTRRQPRLTVRNLMRVGVLSALTTAAGGCAATGLSPSARRSDGGASITTSPPVHHARIPRSLRTQIPGICRLCDEYDLVEIRSQDEWRAFVVATGLKAGDYEFDFIDGRVIGVVAYVGTPMTPHWPIDIDAVGRTGADGWVMARLRPTLYHLVTVPGYCTFTYVTGASRISRVDVHPRSFALHY